MVLNRPGVIRFTFNKSGTRTKHKSGCDASLLRPWGHWPWWIQGLGVAHASRVAPFCAFLAPKEWIGARALTLCIPRSHNKPNPFPRTSVFHRTHNDFIAPCAHEFAWPWPSMCPARCMGFRGIESKSKSCFCIWTEICQRGKVKLYTADRRMRRAAGEWAIASAAVGRGRWHSAVLHLAKHVPWAVLRAREKKQKGAKNVLLHFRRPVHRPLNSAAF